MQVFPQWTPPTGVLGELTRAAVARAVALEARRDELERQAAEVAAAAPFGESLRRDTVAVIAELKRRSPSKGDIAPALSAGVQARAYKDGGAAALSILTEPERFGGAPEDVGAALRATGGTVPVLKKDFHVAPVQLVEARALGASAALLIVRSVPPASLAELVRTADALGLETLVEIRDERELEAALAAGARVIGVNNRNLETLAIDAVASDRVIPLIPADRVAVYESGITGPADVTHAAASGADAVLVGSSISAALDPAGAVRALACIGRRGRADLPVPTSA